MGCLGGKTTLTKRELKGYIYPLNTSLAGICSVLCSSTTLVENCLMGNTNLINNPLTGLCSSLNGFTGNMQCINAHLTGNTSLVCTVPYEVYLKVSKDVLWLSPSDLFDILSNTDWEIK